MRTRPPPWPPMKRPSPARSSPSRIRWACTYRASREMSRSEEHTSELQSRQYLVCRLLLEKNNPQSRHPVRCWRPAFLLLQLPVLLPALHVFPSIRLLLLLVPPFRVRILASSISELLMSEL